MREVSLASQPQRRIELDASRRMVAGPIELQPQLEMLRRCTLFARRGRCLGKPCGSAVWPAPLAPQQLAAAEPSNALPQPTTPLRGPRRPARGGHRGPPNQTISRQPTDAHTMYVHFVRSPRLPPMRARYDARWYRRDDGTCTGADRSLFADESEGRRAAFGGGEGDPCTAGTVLGGRGVDHHFTGDSVGFHLSRDDHRFAE